MKKLIRLLPAIAVLVVHMESSANASPPPGPYFNGFEKNTAGWFDGADRAIVRRPSGYMNGLGGYANGISSADGNWHARFPATTACQQNCDGPFTRWGGYSATFPPGGYLTQLDIYLDVSWAATHNDYRFDWISAINDNTGSFLRDFVFNVGTQLAGPPHYTIQTSPNSTRSGANPNSPCPDPSTPPNTCRPPVLISTSGWFTFRHTFRDDAGTLAVDFDIFPHGSTTPILHQTIFADPMSTVGGNRYGWFSNEEIPDLAVDNSLRTGVCHRGDGDGNDADEHGKGGHHHFHKKSTCGDPNDQEDDNMEWDDDSGSHFQSASVTASNFTIDDNFQTFTMVGTGTHDGLPVGFTMVALNAGDGTPPLFEIILTDGYAYIGSLVSGTIDFQ